MRNKPAVLKLLVLAVIAKYPDGITRETVGVQEGTGGISGYIADCLELDEPPVSLRSRVNEALRTLQAEGHVSARFRSKGGITKVGGKGRWLHSVQASGRQATQLLLDEILEQLPELRAQYGAASANDPRPNPAPAPADELKAAPAKSSGDDLVNDLMGKIEELRGKVTMLKTQLSEVQGENVRLTASLEAAHKNQTHAISAEVEISARESLRQLD